MYTQILLRVYDIVSNTYIYIYIYINKCKNFSLIKVLKDVGMAVPKTRETRAEYSGVDRI